MKSAVLCLIKLYKVFLSPFSAIFPAAGCRFYPTCSAYAYYSVEKYGVLKGLWMGIGRILKCNPWN